MSISSTPKAYNYTAKRAKALPVVEHATLWKCILISKERDRKSKHWKNKWRKLPGTGKWSLFGWGNEEFIKNGKRYQENSRDALERELREELWNDFDLVKVFDLKKSKRAVWEILSDKRWKLQGRRTSNSVKQRLFAVLLSGDIQLHWTDKHELTWIWFYPIEHGDTQERVRKELEGNMDEFAIQALRGNISILRWNHFQTWDINIQHRKWKNDLLGFENILNEVNNNRTLVDKILQRWKV